MRTLLVVAVALLAEGASAESAESEYQLDAYGWNGLSQLRSDAREQGCALDTPLVLDWNALSPGDALWLLYPRVPLDVERVGAFLTDGGTLVIADDFGAAGPLFDALGIRRSSAPLPPDVARWQNRGELPVARATLGTALGRSTSELTANHPAWFTSSLPATFSFVEADGQEHGLVVEGRVGKGHLVALADPSVLINDMLALPGNRAFARQLAKEACGTNGHVALFTGQIVATPAWRPVDHPLDELRRQLAMLRQALRPDAHTLDPLLASAASRAILGLGFGALCLLLFTGGFPAPARLARRWRRLTEGLAPHPDAPPLDGDSAAARRYALALLERRVHARFALPAGPLDGAARRRLRRTVGNRTARAIFAVERWRARGTAPSSRTLLTLHRALGVQTPAAPAPATR